MPHLKVHVFLPQPVIKGLVLYGVVAVSYPLRLEYVHRLWKSRRERVWEAGPKEAGYAGSRLAAPHLSHDLCGAHLPSVHRAVNAALQRLLGGKSQVRAGRGGALAAPAFATLGSELWQAQAVPVSARLPSSTEIMGLHCCTSNSGAFLYPQFRAPTLDLTYLGTEGAL